FIENDLPAAQKTLTMLAPFASRDFGTHARYLLARMHHLSDERPEATLHYDGTVSDHKQRLTQAAALLKQPQQFKNDPAIRAELAMPRLARGKAAGAPDAATKPQEHKQAITSAVNILRQALTRAQQLGDAYPDARGRRGVIVLEMADQLQAIKEHRDAAQKYQ